MTEMVQVICPENEVEYFCRQDWTGQISLIRQEKLDFTRDWMAYLERAFPAALGPVRRTRLWTILPFAAQARLTRTDGPTITITVTSAWCRLKYRADGLAPRSWIVYSGLTERSE
jgi:hypothetical protein